MATGSGGPDGGGGPDREMSRYIGQPNTIYRAPQSVANQNTANAVKKRRSSNLGRAAMTGLGMIGKLGPNANPFLPFSAGMPFGAGLPLAGPAASAFLHALMNKPGFNYDPVAAGRMSSRDLRKLGSVFPQTESEKHRVFMGPGLDAEVGGSGRTRRDIQQEKLLHPGGPLAFSLAHRETLDPDIRKRLAEVIPEDAIVHFRELGQGGNRFTDVMRDGRRISRTRGHMLPVHEAFGLPMQRFNSGGDVTGGGHNMRSKRAAELLHQAFGLPVQRFYSGGSVGGPQSGVEGRGTQSSLGGSNVGGPQSGVEGMAANRAAAEARSIADAEARSRAVSETAMHSLNRQQQAARNKAAEAASFNAHEAAMHDLNRQQQAARNKAAESTGFIENAWNSLFTKDLVDRTGFQAERDAASPGPDFDFLQNQAASGIAGLLPGVSDSPAGTGGESSYYDAVRLASITGITVAQAQAYLNSMYGTA